MADATFADLARLQADADTADVALAMVEEAFRAFYDRTSGALWGYLSRISGDRQTADDLLQESYYRLLRARVTLDDEAHRRHYLFKIATNLARDGHRRKATTPELVGGGNIEAAANDSGSAIRSEARLDVRRAFARLKRRERELLWLAYAQGSSHEEIGAALGLKTGSIKPLLFRAKHKLAAVLRGRRAGAGDHA